MASHRGLLPVGLHPRLDSAQQLWIITDAELTKGLGHGLEPIE